MADFDLHRKVVAHMTTKSWQEIPHVTYVYEPDLTDFYKEYQKLNPKITFNTMLLKVIAEGLKAVPALNAHLTYNDKTARGRILEQASINIAIPWLLPDGRLLTPVLPNAESLTLVEISAAIARLETQIEATDVDCLLYETARAKTLSELRNFQLGGLLRILANRPLKRSAQSPDGLKPEDLLSATVTVSNIGSLYKEQRGFFALLEIIPPQVCAIGIGALSERAGVYEDKFGKKVVGVRKVLPMCIAFDHRALDFNEVVPFLKALDRIFQSPKVIWEW